MISFQSKPFLLLAILGALMVQTINACADDATYTFSLSYDPATSVNCSWLTKNLKKRAIRIATYCPTVKTKCQFSCGTCTIPVTSSPVKSPTASPSLSTAPSNAPFKSPSTKPSLSKVPSRNPSSVPSRKPSTSPSSKPSIKPTTSSKPSTSKMPSSQPSSKPVATPTASPSSAPSDGCKDSTTFTFKVESTSVSVKCSWITKNNIASKDAKRIAKYCANTQIKSQCTKTCSNCTTSPCADDATHRFIIPATGMVVGCEWITKNNMKTTIRRANHCSANGTKCPKACGTCS